MHPCINKRIISALKECFIKFVIKMIGITMLEKDFNSQKLYSFKGKVH